MAVRCVDVDGHVLEPADLWTRNLEENYRDRALRLRRDEKGLEYWDIPGSLSTTFSRGLAANVATIGKSREWRKEHIFEKHDVSWEDGLAMVPGAWDPRERIKLMDEEGIDVSILYPTLGLALSSIEDTGLAAACCRVYNDWIVDFCRARPERLVPAIVLPWKSVEESVEELRRHSRVSPKAVQAPSGPPHDIPYGHPHWDAIWAEHQRQGVPVSLHVGTAGTSARSILHPEIAHPAWWTFVVESTDVMASFVSFFQGAVFDRFPELRLLVLESGCLWMPYFLERMDENYDRIGFTTPMRRRPSDYFEKQCWISMEPDDELGPTTIKLLGADRVVWAYDYPHSDSCDKPVIRLKENLKELPEPDRARVIGGNACEIYGL
jgi:predicted TIM-barrel fold metal-dependent hydrolase